MTGWWATSFDPSCLHHPVSPNRRNRRRSETWLFLRGYSPVSFRSFGFCGQWRSLKTIFGLRSLHAKIPFPAAGLRAANGGPVELTLKELQAIGLFTCLCFLGAVIDLILN